MTDAVVSSEPETERQTGRPIAATRTGTMDGQRFVVRLEEFLARNFRATIAALVILSLLLFVLTLTPFMREKETEAFISVTGYALEDTTGKFVVEGKSSLSEGDLLAIEAYPLEGTLYAPAQGEISRFLVEVQRDGKFFANVPAGETEDPILVRFAYSSQWQRNENSVLSEDELRGAYTIGESSARQLYAQEILFRDPIF